MSSQPALKHAWYHSVTVVEVNLFRVVAAVVCYWERNWAVKFSVQFLLDFSPLQSNTSDIQRAG